MLDKNSYETGQRISDEEMQELRLKDHPFHGNWNYTLQPRRRPVQKHERTQDLHQPERFV